MDVRAFDFDLPPELIAQEPPRERGGSRLLHLDRATGAIQHTSITAFPDLLRAGDLVVVNDTRVFPARLLGRRIPTGGAVECLLVARLEGQPPRPPDGEVWEALLHPGQKMKPGARVVFEGSRTIHGEILEQRFFGRRVVRLWTDDGSTIDEAVDAIGHMPLPPYIKRDDAPADRDRYQTVFAQARGSIAAPTAGLHFTPAILDALRARGVGMATITLHVGYGTFQPVRVERVEDHRVEAERYEVSAAAAAALSRARAEGRRIIAVGTTTTRTLEHIARSGDGAIAAGGGATDLFIYPGFEFQIVNALLTNFHLPKSSLLMLVAAFAGLDLVRSAYDAAVAAGYRFYSYGDAMFVT
jgi:S-adenosylmethionine:tRNA ribosyltransferase-isomerase